MAEITSQFMDGLARAYSAGLGRIQIAAEQATVDAWFAHNTFNSEDDPAWEAVFLAILLAAGTAAASLTTQFYQVQRDYLGVAPRVVTPNIADRLRADFAGYGGSPPVRARYLWDKGATPDLAISQAATRVSKLASVAVREAEQDALSDLFDQLDFEVVWTFEDQTRPDQFFRPATNADVSDLTDEMRKQYRMSRRGKGAIAWFRVPQAGACGWCLAQSTRILSDETRKRGEGWHTFCRCGWRLATPKESTRWSPISSQEFKDLLPIRSEPTPPIGGGT